MAARYMLDTDVSSYLIRGTDHALNQKVAAKAGRLCMSSITYHELLYGARARGSAHIESAISALAELAPVVTFSPDAADRAAAIRSSLDGAGKTIGVMDALIAASAMAENCILVTNNTAHFSRVQGLKIENWTSPRD